MGQHGAHPSANAPVIELPTTNYKLLHVSSNTGLAAVALVGLPEHALAKGMHHSCALAGRIQRISPKQRDHNKMLLRQGAHIQQPFTQRPVRCCSRIARLTAGSSGSSSTRAHSRQADASIDRRAVTAVLLPGLLWGSLAVQAPPAEAKSTAGDWSSPGLAAPEDDAAPKFFKTASGVKVQQLAAGSGPEATTGDYVLFDYVLRRANGYFIYGTIEGVSFQPRDVPVGPVSFQLGSGALIPGLEEVLTGMQPGGKRRALVPPEQGYLVASALEPQPPTFATKRQLENHKSEPLLFELQLLKVRPG